MKTLAFSLAREFKLIVRNGISLFMVAAPALLAVIFIVVFGAVQTSSLTLGADASVSDADAKKLEQVADVARYDTYDALIARIKGPDAVAGVTVENGQTVIVVEGNEGGDFATAMDAIVGAALGTGDLSYSEETIEPKGNRAYDMSMIGVLLLSLFIGGATVGLGIVSERETGAIKAVAVSPLRLGGYVVTKVVPAILLCIAGMIAATLIMGKAEQLPGFLLLAVCSIFVSGMMIFILGAFASNQIAAIGVMKLLMPLSLVLPISAMFLSDKWQFLYYVFPMYWQYIAIRAINDGAAIWQPCLLALGVSLPWFAATVLLFGKKTTLRIGR